MKKTSFFTIKALDYKTIENEIYNQNLSPELIKNLKTSLEDHKGLTKIQKKIIEVHLNEATAAFKLFEDPIVQENNVELNPNSEIDWPPENENDSPEKNLKPKNKTPRKKPSDKTIFHALLESDKKCTSFGNNMHLQRSITKTYVLAVPMITTETRISESCLYPKL